MSQAGTYNCPICGYGKPHGHSDDVTAAWRSDQVRGDGWISVLVRMPASRGFYLCTGHKVTAHDDREVWRIAHERLPHFVTEVLHFDSIAGSGFHLPYAPWVGGARGIPSSQRLVWVQPTYWRELPDAPSKTPVGSVQGGYR